MSDINVRDLAFKALWTALAAGAGFAVTAGADLPTWWALPLTIAANFVAAFARQKLGATPPDARTLTAG